MRRIWFDRHEPPILDHRLAAAAGNAQRAKGCDAAALCGHLRFLTTDIARRWNSVCPRSRVGSPQTVASAGSPNRPFKARSLILFTFGCRGVRLSIGLACEM